MKSLITSMTGGRSETRGVVVVQMIFKDKDLSLCNKGNSIKTCLQTTTWCTTTMEEAASTTTAFKIIEEEDLVAEVDFRTIEVVNEEVSLAFNKIGEGVRWETTLTDSDSRTNGVIMTTKWIKWAKEALTTTWRGNVTTKWISKTWIYNSNCKP